MYYTCVNKFLKFYPVVKGLNGCLSVRVELLVETGTLQHHTVPQSKLPVE